MKLIDELTRQTTPGAFLCAVVGTFDGVHRGHTRLLEEAVKLAKADDVASAAIVFRRQPREVLQPEQPVIYLSSFEDRLNRIKSSGIDSVILLDFDSEIRALEASRFLQILHNAAGVRSILLGPSAVMGSDRAGADDLTASAAELGIRVVRVAGERLPDGSPVSSSRIRRALLEGRVEEAGQLLGRPYSVEGVVVKGDGRGRKLGYPTANLLTSDSRLIPADGIYASYARFRGTSYAAATSIGIRPTFEDERGERKVEAYVVGYEGDLYHQQMRISFVSRIRDELRFEGAEPLIDQMKRDVAQVVSIVETNR